jgi:hypothetical protein
VDGRNVARQNRNIMYLIETKARFFHLHFDQFIGLHQTWSGGFLYILSYSFNKNYGTD